MRPQAIVGLVTGVVVAIPAIWCVVVLALSYASGWHALAASYESKEPPRGTRFAGQSGSVGGVSYRNSLTIHVASDGLFLSVLVLFRIGHKPLFLPWSAITNPKPVKFLWHEVISFQVGSPPGTRISLPPAIFEARNARGSCEETPSGNRMRPS